MNRNSKRSMKKDLMRSGWLMLPALSALIVQPAIGVAQTTAFTYQGRLSNGANPADGYYDFRFGLEDAASGGNQIAGPLTNTATSVSNGLFAVTLDFGGAFSGTNYWLDIGVRTNGSGTFSSLTPRQAITPSPYALFAPAAATITGTVRGAQVTGQLADVQLSANIPRLNGNPVFTGAAQFSSANGTFAGSGAGLTNLNLTGTNFTGILTDAHLSTNVALLNATQVFSGSITFKGSVTSSNAASAFVGSFFGNGAGLTNLSGGASSTNAALLNGTQAFSGQNTFQGAVLATNAASTFVGSFSGNGAGLTNLNTGLSLTNAAQLSATQTFTGQNIFQGVVLATNGASTFSGRFTGDGTSLTNLTVANVWKLTGNGGSAAGTDFLGTTDAQPLELRVNGGRCLRLEPGGTVPNLIAGSPANSVAAGVSGASIGGGGTATSPNAEAADFGTISGGWSNSIGASATSSTIGGGWVNVVDTGSSNAVIAGGVGNTIQAAASYGVIGGGATNQIMASAQYATVPGGHGASVDKFGQFALASGVFTTAGDAQTSVYVLRGTSSSAALGEIYLDGLTRRLTVPLNSAWMFRILLVGHGAASGTSHAFEIAGLVVNNNGTPALFGGTNTLSFGDAGFTSSVSAASGPVALVIQGQRTPATEVIRWVATVYTSELRW